MNMPPASSNTSAKHVIERMETRPFASKPQQTVGNGRASVDPDRIAIEECSTSLACCEELIDGRLVDEAGDGFVAFHQRYGNAPFPVAMQKAACTVDRIDHPAIAACAFRQPGFLAEKPVIGESGRDATADQVLDLTVGNADHVLTALLLLDDQRFQIAEMAKRQCSLPRWSGHEQTRSGYRLGHYAC